MRLHKSEIAKRQIEAACEIFFSQGDFLAVVTLAGAAEEILGSLVRRNSGKAMIDYLVELDKEISGGRNFSVLNAEINGVRNALKHARDVAEDEIEVEEGEALAMLSRAVTNFVLYSNGEITQNMLRLFAYLQDLYRRV